MPAGDVVLLVVDNSLCRIAAWRLAQRFPDLTIIVEQHVPRFQLIRGRIRRFGLFHTAGQLAFILYSRLVRRRAAGRIAEIVAASGLEARWPDGIERIEVVSVNAPDTVARLQELRPKVVLVVGTRIISRMVLSAVQAPFINYHDGITPKYRGIHGGYWASAQNDLANFGATVHLVDPGIDTGDCALPGAAAAVGRGQLRDLLLPAARCGTAASRARRRGRDRRDRDAADGRPAVASVVAPDDLALLHDGHLPRGVVRVVIPDSASCATGNPNPARDEAA